MATEHCVKQRSLEFQQAFSVAIAKKGAKAAARRSSTAVNQQRRQAAPPQGFILNPVAGMLEQKLEGKKLVRAERQG